MRHKIESKHYIDQVVCDLCGDVQPHIDISNQHERFSCYAWASKLIDLCPACKAKVTEVGYNLLTKDKNQNANS